MSPTATTSKNMQQQQQQIDWASMIYDVFGANNTNTKNNNTNTNTTQYPMVSSSLPQSTTTSTSTSPSFSPLQYPKGNGNTNNTITNGGAMSPLATVNEEVWLDDLLNDDAIYLSQQAQQQSQQLQSFDQQIAGHILTNTNTAVTTRRNSFENVSSLNSSNSLFSQQQQQQQQQQNLRTIKLESQPQQQQPQPQPQPQQGSEELDSANLSRNSSIDSMFKDFFSDLEDGTGTGANSNDVSPAAAGEQQQQQNAAGQGQGQAQAKPKKKRAPRKRLTDHQKQAHNKIEKRYRININAKIAGLQKLIPWVSNEKTAFEIGDETNDKDIIKKENEEHDIIDDDEATNTATTMMGTIQPSARMNKSMILDKATMYILHLQENERLLKQENEELKLKLRSNNENNNSNNNNEGMSF